MKLLSSIKGKKQTTPSGVAAKKHFDVSASTIDISVPASVSMELTPSCDSCDQQKMSKKEEKKKTKEAEKALAKAIKDEAKELKRQEKEEAKAIKEELKRQKKQAKVSKKAEKRALNIRHSTTSALNVQDLLSSMDSEQILVVLKKLAEENSSDLLGVECLKAIARAEKHQSHGLRRSCIDSTQGRNHSSRRHSTGMATAEHEYD